MTTLKVDKKKRDRCKRCIFWVTDIDNPLIIEDDSEFDEGECHGAPPGESGRFPLTDEDDWCGMWKDRKSKVACSKNK
jgi:hypothetical protein